MGSGFSSMFGGSSGGSSGGMFGSLGSLMDFAEHPLDSIFFFIAGIILLVVVYKIILD